MNRTQLRLSFALVALSLAAAVAIAADEPKQVSYPEMITRNGDNIVNITSGMTKNEVLKVMGNIQSKVKNGPISNPWKTEFYDDLEILHYITSRHPPFMPIMKNQTTPIILKAGKVVGVGRAALNEAKASSSPTRKEGRTQPERSIKERLDTLQGLYDSGTIDKETYKAQKAKILDSI